MTSNLTLSATLISSTRLPNRYAGLILGQYADRASVRRNNRGRFQSGIVRHFRFVNTPSLLDCVDADWNFCLQLLIQV